MTRKIFHPLFLAFIFLSFQNIALFFTHYFGDFGFPWDFSLSYFAVPYYWISCVQHGMLPQWVAQEAMGYPLFMNLQSGLFYPPLWIIALTGKTYSLHTAVILQCLHILLGAVGMCYFAWIQKVPRIYCLIAGIAYQFFGGFYGNAEHVDIIRGFALIPWYLSGLTICQDHFDRYRSVLLIPLTVFLMFTGSYMGLAIAALWIGGWYILIQIGYLRSIATTQKLTLALHYYALIALGILLSTMQILPAWLQHDAIARAHVFSIIDKTFWGWKNYFTLFMSSDTTELTQDISMRSAYITLPIFGLLFFITSKILKKNMVLVILFIITAVMISNNIIENTVIRIFSPLGLSRFPIADYRAYMDIFLIFLSIASLQQFIENKLLTRHFVMRSSLFVLTIIAGWYFLYFQHTKFYQTSHLILLALTLLVFLAIKQFTQTSNKTLLIFFISLVLIDGTAMWYSSSFLWRTPHITQSYLKNYDINLTKSPSEELIHQLGPIPYRPNRLESELPPYSAQNMPWRGYLTGDFMLYDYSGGMQLLRQISISQNPTILNFMQQSSSTILASPQAISDINQLQNIIKTTPSNNVAMHLISYANDKIEYQAHLSQPQLLIENETYFPGWSAMLVNSYGSYITITAVSAANLLRGWNLPAGNYTLIESFHMPYLHLALLISLLGFLLWSFILLLLFYQYTKNTSLK